MQIAGLHRFVSPAEFGVFIFFWEVRKTALLRRHKKLFKFCARKKTKSHQKAMSAKWANISS
jgi:hypothetical protein